MEHSSIAVTTDMANAALEEEGNEDTELSNEAAVNVKDNVIPA
jgi:hypothetical protein